VDKLFPALEFCYKTSSLYFSPISVPCSNLCLDATIEASKYLTDACDIHLPTKDTPMISHRELIYSLWASKKSAYTVCKLSSNGRYCLQELAFYAPRLAFPDGRKLNPKEVCSKCNKKLYKRFAKKPFSIPIVYYQIMNDPDVVLKALGELCQWNKNVEK